MDDLTDAEFAALGRVVGTLTAAAHFDVTVAGYYSVDEGADPFAIRDPHIDRDSYS